MSRTSSLEIISHKGELPSLDHTRLRKIRKKYLYKFNELWVWYLFATIFYKKNKMIKLRTGMTITTGMTRAGMMTMRMGMTMMRTGMTRVGMGMMTIRTGTEMTMRTEMGTMTI